MAIQKSYTVGKIYSLDEIRPLASQLKMIAHKATADGLFMLYREKDNQNYWVGGPLQGKGSNLFLFMGPHKSKGLFLKFLSEEFGLILKGIDRADIADDFFVDDFFDTFYWDD